MARTRLKVCCIGSIDEAHAAISAGADAIGLVARMPSGPGPIPDGLIRDIAGRVPPPVATFLLTSEVVPEAVIKHIALTGVNTVQLVDDEIGSEVWEALRSEVPGVRVVQVIHVRDQGSIDRAMHAAAWVDALLLDSGDPTAAVRQLGGTGRVHDWGVSREIVVRSGVPVFLAGGLNPTNVGDAIRAVRPFGIDLCSGVRAGGRLDVDRLERLVAAMREADA